MRKELIEKEIIGKTVEGIIYSFSGQMILTFTDKTFIQFGINYDYDGDTNIEVEKLDLFDFEDDELIKVDITTKEKLENLHKQQNEKFVKDREQKERLLYEQLHKKFGK